MKYGVILALLVAILWSLVEVEYTKIYKKIDRSNIYFYQFFTRTIIYFLTVVIFDASIISSFNSEKLFVFLPIVLCDLIASVVINFAVVNGKLSVVSPIMASYPALDIIFGLLILGEKMDILTIVLVNVIALSIVVLASNSKKNDSSPHFLIGIFFAFIYTFLIAFSTIFEKNVYNLSYSVYEFYYYKSLIYFLVSILFALVIFVSPVKIKRPTKDILKGSVLTPLGNVLYSFAISFGNVIVVTPVSSIYSMFTSIMSTRVLKERLSLKEKVCISLIIFSTIVLVIANLI